MLEGHSAYVWAMQPVGTALDGQMLASCSADKTVRLWNCDPDDRTGFGECTMVAEGHRDSVYSMAVFPNQARPVALPVLPARAVAVSVSGGHTAGAGPSSTPV